jgi:hypothetical protein
MTITGIVYALLLSDVDVPLSSRWVNATLHEILPLFLLADRIFLPPRPRASGSVAVARGQHDLEADLTPAAVDHPAVRRRPVRP